jgi:hypothetical protein
VPSQDFWKAALRGCPDWMRWSVYGLFGYVLLNVGGGVLRGAAPTAPTPLTMSASAAGLMAFHGVAFAILYSRLRLGPPRVVRCAAGHEAPPLATFCPTCGRPLPPRGDPQGWGALTPEGAVSRVGADPRR